MDHSIDWDVPISELSFDDDDLSHFGVKGMHWGHRKNREALEAKAGVHEQQAQAHADVANQLRDDAEELDEKGFHSKVAKRVYGENTADQTEWQFYVKNGQNRSQALQQTHNNLRMAYNMHVRAMNRHAKAAEKLHAQAAEATHFDTAEEFLEHFGVKGMHWGVHHEDPEGVSKKTSHEAQKDAEEFARAKMFYGEGAGTRRKLIKATVNAKSSKDPNYKKAFDHHLANQDMSEHAEKARAERKRKNATKSTAKTARGVRHVLNGNAQYASLAAAMITGGAMAAHKHGIDKVVMDAGKTAYKKATDPNNAKANSKLLNDLGS